MDEARPYSIAHPCEWCGNEPEGSRLYYYEGIWQCRECIADKLTAVINTMPSKSMYDFEEEYKDE